MDFRAVLIFLCLLIAQAACGVSRHDIKKDVWNRTIQEMQDKILPSILQDFAEPGQLPSMSCLYLNTTELGERQEQNLTVYHLSSFRCYIEKLSQLNQLSGLFLNLTQKLQNISQHIMEMEQLVSHHPAREDCSLPTLEDVVLCVYVKCLLQHLDQRLRNAML